MSPQRTIDLGKLHALAARGGKQTLYEQELVALTAAVEAALELQSAMHRSGVWIREASSEEMGRAAVLAQALAKFGRIR